MKGIKVIYTPEQFKEKGFDGEIAKYMRENKNTAIVGNYSGIDRHVISFSDNKVWTKYSENNPYTKSQDGSLISQKQTKHNYMITIKDIEGNKIEVTDLKAAIKQCKECSDSPYKMASGYTVGENHRFMLKQLEELLQGKNRDKWLPSTQKKYAEGKRFTKEDMGYQIGMIEPYHPASLCWDTLPRDTIVRAFNKLFGTEIK
jgi:hypothetical protein